MAVGSFYRSPLATRSSMFVSFCRGSEKVTASLYSFFLYFSFIKVTICLHCGQQMGYLPFFFFLSVSFFVLSMGYFLRLVYIPLSVFHNGDDGRCC